MEMNEYLVKEDPLICTICLDLWIGKNPRALPCQHTFCEDCLKTTIANKCIVCPQCRLRTQLPNGKISDLPKSVFDSNITINSVQFCSRHYQKLIEPRFVCQSCHMENLCEECLNNCHTQSTCVIKSHESIKQDSKEFKDNCQKHINQWTISIKNEIDYLQKKLFELEKTWYSTIREKLIKLRNRIEKYEEDKFGILKTISENIENTFFDEDLWIESIKTITNTVLIDNNKLEIQIDYDIMESELNDLKIIKTSSELTTNSPFHTCFSFGTDGYYGLNPIIDAKKLLYISGLNVNNNKQFQLDKSISNFVISDNYIYALEEETGRLLSAKKPFDQMINLNIINEDEKFDSLVITENIDIDERYALLNTTDSTLIFLNNDKFIWKNTSLSSAIADFCILNNGTSIVASKNLLFFFDKEDGNILRKIKTEISIPISVCSHPKSGFFQVNLNESIIKYYDDNVNLNRVYFVGYSPWCIRFSNCDQFYLINDIVMSNHIFFRFKLTI
ncbi:unnamed protein product [Dimorphilus gyrociliatus]|uniref:RING-type domain-containing protein n=1 Tax=Dimorphilus gyrociliatus TaxID=2664684 RepID=A0A7I8VEF5_9ANNE|nr:unnamed protein product [Dimorphilus gyrociliatus]